MRLVVPVTIALALVALPGAAAKLPDVIVVPTYKAGDTWSIDGGDYTETHEVVSVEDGVVQIRVTQTNADGSTTAQTRHLRASDLAVVKVVTDRFTEQWDSPCVQNEWPLKVGKTWSSSCTGAYVYGDGNRYPTSGSLTGKVVRIEDVTIESGTFETMLVERQAGDFVTRQWIAPGQCAPVKETVGAPGTEESVRELKTSACAGSSTMVEEETPTPPPRGTNTPPLVECRVTEIRAGVRVTWTVFDADTDDVDVRLFHVKVEKHAATGSGEVEFGRVDGILAQWEAEGNDGMGGVVRVHCSNPLEERAAREQAAADAEAPLPAAVALAALATATAVAGRRRRAS